MQEIMIPLHLVS